MAPRPEGVRLFRALAASPFGRLTLAATGALLLFIAVGLIALWPSGGQPALSELLREDRASAEVQQVAPQLCNRPQGRNCRQLVVTILEGRTKDTVQSLTIGENGYDPGELSEGDRVVVAQGRNPLTRLPTGEYYLVDTGRSGTLGLLFALFAVGVAVLGRWRGVMSLLGLGISLLVVTGFIVPALLDDKSPLLVALVGSFAVMVATITLAHGTGAKSMAAILGTAASLILTVGLATGFTDVASLTGFTSDEALAVRFADREISLQGLVTAGMVIAALGVLDDVTVSQSSTVLALRRANPALGLRRLFSEAMDVGRDHVSATVNTLVFAYVGASLPLLLYFSVGDIPLSDALDREAVAQQLVGVLVGSLGLLAAVPLTTGLAALLARLLPEAVLPEDAHVH
jgi:uncharacterized membrane protein